VKWAALSDVNAVAADDVEAYAAFAAWATPFLASLTQQIRGHDWTGTWSRRKDCCTPAYIASWAARGKTEADARNNLNRPYVQNWARPNTEELAYTHTKPGVWNVTTFAYAAKTGGGGVGAGAAGSSRLGSGVKRKGGGAKGLFFRGHGRGLTRAKTSVPISLTEAVRRDTPPTIAEEAGLGGGGHAAVAAGAGRQDACADDADEGVDSAGDSSGPETDIRFQTIGTQLPRAVSSTTHMKPRYRERKQLNPRRHLTYHIGDWTETYLGSSTMFGDSKRVVTLRRRTVWLPEPDADPDGGPCVLPPPAPASASAHADGAASTASALPPPGLVLRTAHVLEVGGGGSRSSSNGGGLGPDDVTEVANELLSLVEHAAHANSGQIAHSTLTHGPRGLEETRRFFRGGHMVVRRIFAPANSPGTRFVHDELFKKNVERAKIISNDDANDRDGGAVAAAAAAAAGSTRAVAAEGIAAGAASA